MKQNTTPQIHPFKIGNILIPNPLVLAPLAGITDIVFRPIIKRMGAGLVYSEMVSCMAIKHKNKKTLAMLDYHPSENPLAIQIFGSDPVVMADAAKLIESLGVKLLDINLGCSVPKVSRSGAGAIVCRDLPHLARILEAVVNAVSIPVTIKIRKGWNQEEISAFEVCRIARECGIAAIAIHGRTSSQKFSGKADWEFIKELRKVVDLPLIGNGDIENPQQVKEMLEYTGCEGIMIGRKAYPYPWIFREALNHLMGSPPIPRPTFEERKEMILEHLQGMVDRYGDNQGTRKMRKFAAWFTRGMPNSTFFRDKVYKVNYQHELVDMVNRYFDRLM